MMHGITSEQPPWLTNNGQDPQTDAGDDKDTGNDEEMGDNEDTDDDKL